MGERDVSRHPSYNNRFRTSLNGQESLEGRSVKHSDASSIVLFPDQPTGVSTIVVSNQPPTVSGIVLSPEKRTSVSATDRRLQYTRSGSHSDKTLRSISFESNPDDVFVDIGHNDGFNVNSKKLIKPTPSTASSASMLPNPYNRFNHKVHSIVWCACCLYFVLICCLPAVHYMEESDTAFRRGDEIKAKRTGKMSSLMFVAGTFISLAFYAGILFLVIFFTAFNT